jgi:Flp pilus assembly protein TadD
MRTVAHKERGTCPECGRDSALRSDGTLHAHRAAGGLLRCTGGEAQSAGGAVARAIPGLPPNWPEAVGEALAVLDPGDFETAWRAIGKAVRRHACSAPSPAFRA